LHAWQDVTATTLTQDEIQMLIAMDDAFLKSSFREQREAREADRQQAKPR
jgi:hypothetical protein